jgi:hypothetical protein
VRRGEWQAVALFVALSLALLFGGMFVIGPGECHTGKAFCGCPNKAACGQDDETNCTSCCESKCKGGSPATRGP